MPALRTIAPCLWFDHQAEEAAAFYVSIFPGSRIGRIARYGEAGHEFHGRAAGSVMTVEFELDGQPFTALNGGPVFRFNEAVSFQILCDTQQDIDHYWDRLTEGGDTLAQQCGWLKDRYGLSWQVVPAAVIQMMCHPDQERRDRVMNAILPMKKLVIAELERAFEVS